MESGLIFNIQKYSVHDGPGIRTTVFFKGCPLRCVWCHNPEGICPDREIMVVESRCLECGACRSACRHGESVPGEGPLPTRLERCEWCGACVEACPTQARQMVGREMSVSEVLAVVLQDQVFYEDSHGGVTFSGGEPLLQPEFLVALLAACRELGLHTAVDTCGLAPTEVLLRIAALTDVFLYDLKVMDEEKHRCYTGASNRAILENLLALGRVHSRIWVRVPVIPGVNDDKAELEATARFAASVPGVRQVNLLPYHRTGLQKAQRLGRTSALAQVQPPCVKDIEEVVGIFQSMGLNAKQGG